jgi:AMP-binding enzyme C-terminal domain
VGIGLAEGYLNLPDKTREAFTPDFAGMPGNPSRRIYRTGDLGKITADGQIVHKGRIDTQVKIRGYRIELAEIESVLAEAPGVAQAVVTTYESGLGVVELAGYYRLRRDAGTADADALHAHLRERLPAYMVPAYLVEVAEIPMTTGGKVDRKSLPPPSGQRHQATRGAYRAPDGITASMRNIYENRTVRRLAAAIDPVADGARQSGAPGAPDAAVMPVPAESLPLGVAVGKPRYALCGALQLLVFAGLIGLLAFALDAGSGWLAAGHGARDVAVRAVVFGVALQAGLAALPIAAGRAGRAPRG